MSIESMAVVLHHAPFKGTEKLILLGIANHDGDGGAWPSIETLAAYGNCSRSSAERSLRALAKAGAIIRHVQQGGTHRMPEWARPNLYELKVTCPENCDKTAKHRAVDKKRSNLWQPPLTSAPPVSSEGGGPSVVKGDPPSVVKAEPSLEPPINLNSSSFVSTSPEDAKTCWGCGQPRALKGSYCAECENTGRNNPMIGCIGEAEGCNAGVRKRTHPGQQFFKCAAHRHATQAKTSL